MFLWNADEEIRKQMISYARMGEEAKMNIIGYCKECSTIIHHEDRIDTTNVYECSKCKHPQTKEEVELRPFEIKSGGEVADENYKAGIIRQDFIHTR